MRQMLLPQGSPGMRAVSMGLIGGRQQHETSAFHALDFAFRDAQFRRVDEVVGRVHLGQGGFDSLQSGEGS